jgi:hypothetical protein
MLTRTNWRNGRGGRGGGRGERRMGVAGPGAARSGAAGPEAEPAVRGREGRAAAGRA